MNTDIRIKVSFKNHRKRKKLRRILGDRSDSYLIDLWLSVSTDAPTGVLTGWDEDDIADSCGWEEDPKNLISALIDSNWLEKNADGEYQIHDWCIHQSWACKADQRSEIARNAALTRWEKKHKSDAVSMLDACGKDAKGNTGSNAPIPSSPIPSSPIINFKEAWDEAHIRNLVLNYQKSVLNKFKNKAPKITESLLENGYNNLRLLINKDGFELKYIRKALFWGSQDQDFWNDKILSLAGIREKQKNTLIKFVNLANAYDRESNSKKNKSQSGSLTSQSEDNHKKIAQASVDRANAELKKKKLLEGQEE